MLNWWLKGRKIMGIFCYSNHFDYWNITTFSEEWLVQMVYRILISIHSSPCYALLISQVTDVEYFSPQGFKRLNKYKLEEVQRGKITAASRCLNSKARVGSWKGKLARGSSGILRRDDRQQVDLRTRKAAQPIEMGRKRQRTTLRMV